MFNLKRMLAGLLLSILLSVSLYATTVRDMGMGLQEYPWFTDGLQSYIYQNPSYLSNYNNISFFERAGALDGQNMGAIFYSFSPSVNVGLHIGRPVDSTIWNSTDPESLFHRGNYEVKGTPTHLTGIDLYLPSGATAYDGYQFEMIDGSIIDLMDPMKGTRDLNTGLRSSNDNVNELLQRNVSLITSYKSGNLALGLDLGYATSWSNKRNSSTAGFGENDEYIFINTEYDAAIGFLYNIDSASSFDGSVGWTMYSIKSSYDKTVNGAYTASLTYETDMAMDINAMLRYNMVLAKNHKLHVRGAYSFINHSTIGIMKVSDEDGTDNNTLGGTDNFIRTGQNIKIGLSDEMNFDKLKAFAGFDIQFKMFTNDYSGKDVDKIANSADKYTNTINSITIPVVIGMEAIHNENWTSRYGIVQRIYQPITNTGENITGSGAVKNPTDYNGNSSSATDLFAGITYKRGNFSFDWLINMNLFVAGPYFVSGKTATGNNVPLAFSTAIAGTYSYDSLISGKSDDADVKPANEVKPEVKTKNNAKVNSKTPPKAN